VNNLQVGNLIRSNWKRELRHAAEIAVVHCLAMNARSACCCCVHRAFGLSELFIALKWVKD